MPHYHIILKYLKRGEPPIIRTMIVPQNCLQSLMERELFDILAHWGNLEFAHIPLKHFNQRRAIAHIIAGRLYRGYTVLSQYFHDTHYLRSLFRKSNEEEGMRITGNENRYMFSPKKEAEIIRAATEYLRITLQLPLICEFHRVLVTRSYFADFWYSVIVSNVCTDKSRIINGLVYQLIHIAECRELLRIRAYWRICAIAAIRRGILKAQRNNEHLSNGQYDYRPIVRVIMEQSFPELTCFEWGMHL
jgi:hypothetical protein